MIRHIIFDMGNVLIRFDREYFISRLGITGADREMLMREVFLSLEWARMDRGTMDDGEATRSICLRLPTHLHEAARKLVSMWDRPILPVEGMYELVRELKEAGYGIYLLSNASFRQHDYWPRVPASRFFDGTYISCDHKLVKPQPEIYREMLASFGLAGEECVFIDDSPANIEGAYFCGIPGIVFHGDTAALRKELRGLGVRVED